MYLCKSKLIQSNCFKIEGTIAKNGLKENCQRAPHGARCLWELCRDDMRKEKEKKKVLVPGYKIGRKWSWNHEEILSPCQHGAYSSTVASSRLAQRDTRRGKVGIQFRIVCSLQHV